jgi:hypothetical protein
MNGDRVHHTKADRSIPVLPDHLPLRPLWLCQTCGQHWPCGRAKLALLADFHGSEISLFLYLAGLLHKAIDDLHRLNPSTTADVRDLFDRFLGWPTRHRSRRSPTAHPQTPEET